MFYVTNHVSNVIVIVDNVMDGRGGGEGNVE